MKCVYRNGVITGYLISLVVVGEVVSGVDGGGGDGREEVESGGGEGSGEGGGSWEERRVSELGEANRRVVFTDLALLTKYSVQVAAVNIAGVGIYSDPLTAVTDSNGSLLNTI